MTADATEAEGAAANDADAMRDALRALMGKGFAPKKAERKQREKQVRATVDGRTLRAKGRTAQLNIKILPELKEALAKNCERKGIAVTDFIETLLRKALEIEGK
jgi:hypothetical protein